MTCKCFIISPSVLDRLAQDRRIRPETRAAFSRTLLSEPIWRKLRDAQFEATRERLVTEGFLPPLMGPSTVRVFDCEHDVNLMGTPVPDPAGSSDASARRAFELVGQALQFFLVCFGRNSLNDLGMSVMAVIHYDRAYTNAKWDGAEMVFGDGNSDQGFFRDFTLSDDIVAHELTHGMVQYMTQLTATPEAAALNESLADVFGSMFRQWRKGQTVDQADWLIGSDLLGAEAQGLGYVCLRNLGDPGNTHCVHPQPQNYAAYAPSADVHDNSGIASHAFFRAAKTMGGHSWDEVGKVWYAAIKSGKAKSNTTFKQFAQLTIAMASQLFPGHAPLKNSIEDAWTSVGV